MGRIASGRRSGRLGAALLLGAALAACDDAPAPTTPLLPAGTPLGAMSARADSTELKRRAQERVTTSATTASWAAIPIQQGQKATVTVAYVRTARCEVVSVSGAINQTVFPQGVGGCGRGGIESDGLGLTAVIGPASSAGELVFAISSPGSSVVSGSGDSWTVNMGDELGDDMDDVVLSVRLEGGRTELKCLPRPIERGQTVRCTLTAGEPFTVLTQRASGRGFSPIEEEPGASYPSGGRHVWEGLAVTAARVEMTVRTTDGDGSAQTRRLTDDIEVRERDWSPLALNAPQVTRGLRGAMQAWPANGHLGNARPEFVQGASTVPIMRASSGPNRNLAFLASVPFVDHSIFLHPGLYDRTGAADLPQQWRTDQNGTGSGTCQQQVFGILTPEVERHEGATMAHESHWGITKEFYQTSGGEQRLERLFTAGGDDELRQRAYDHWLQLHRGTYETRQQNFDRREYPAIAAMLGCTLDVNPRDP